MKHFDHYEKRTVTPEKMIKILARHGTVISLEDAEIALDFLYKLSNLAVSVEIERLKNEEKTLISNGARTPTKTLK
jgi:hypothetical protein